jgi:hypothetical protein
MRESGVLERGGDGFHLRCRNGRVTVLLKSPPCSAIGLLPVNRPAMLWLTFRTEAALESA